MTTTRQAKRMAPGSVVATRVSTPPTPQQAGQLTGGGSFEINAGGGCGCVSSFDFGNLYNGVYGTTVGFDGSHIWLNELSFNTLVRYTFPALTDRTVIYSGTSFINPCIDGVGNAYVLAHPSAWEVVKIDLSTNTPTTIFTFDGNENWLGMRWSPFHGKIVVMQTNPVDYPVNYRSQIIAIDSVGGTTLLWEAFDGVTYPNHIDAVGDDGSVWGYSNRNDALIWRMEGGAIAFSFGAADGGRLYFPSGLVGVQGQDGVLASLNYRYNPNDLYLLHDDFSLEFLCRNQRVDTGFPTATSFDGAYTLHSDGTHVFVHPGCP